MTADGMATASQVLHNMTTASQCFPAFPICLVKALAVACLHPLQVFTLPRALKPRFRCAFDNVLVSAL